jgi:hypothetical protein
MAHVVCVVEAAENKVFFTWYEGSGAFWPYLLTGSRLALFRADARSCREQLDGMARDSLDWVNAGSDDDRQACDAPTCAVPTESIRATIRND